MTNLFRFFLALAIIVSALFMSQTAGAQGINPAQDLGPCDFRLGEAPGTCASDPTCHTGFNETQYFIAPAVDGYCAWNDPKNTPTVTNQLGVSQTLSVMVGGIRWPVAVLEPGAHFYFYQPADANVVKYGGIRIAGPPNYRAAVTGFQVMEFLGNFIYTGSCNPDRGIISADGRYPRLRYTVSSCSR